MKHVMRFVGWCLTYLYGIGVVTVPIANCTQGSDDPWAITLFVEVPILAVGLGLVWLARPWHVADLFLGAPHLATLTFAPISISPFLIKSTFGGQHVCQAHLGYFPDLKAAWWHPAWAPVQFICLAVLGLTVGLTWRAMHESVVRRAA